MKRVKAIKKGRKNISPSKSTYFLLEPANSIYDRDDQPESFGHGRIVQRIRVVQAYEEMLREKEKVCPWPFLLVWVHVH